MAEKLQGLLEKIKTEGLEKAETEKRKILDEAEQEAQKILAQAKAEAELSRKKAEEDAANLEKRAQIAVKQAARDIMLKLKAELQARLENIVRDVTADSMSPEFMAGLIKDLAAAFSKNPSAADLKLELLVAPKDCERLAARLQGSLAASFAATPAVFGDSEIGSGLKIGVKGSEVFFDFSDDAISELICAYVSPKLAELLASPEN
ncbi:MAG: hypothetical protein PHH77_10765 [Victivallaceae bacterium]|nr:hypothetical protein [Victivallaceae bacterium]